MLTTWLVEFYLSKYDELEDAITAGSISQNMDDLKAEYAMVEEEFKQFLQTYKVLSLILFYCVEPHRMSRAT